MMKLLLISIWMVLGVSLWAQETTSLEPTETPFQGEISFKLTWSGTAQVKDELPDSMVMYFSGSKWAAKYYGGLAKKLKSEIIFNAEDSLYWWVNHKMWTAYKMDEAYEAPKPTEVKLAKVETKTILGQKARKTIIKSGESTITYWLSETTKVQALPDSFAAPAPPMLAVAKNGLPLQIEQTSPSGKSIAQAVEIRPGMVDTAKFKVPEGYKVYTFDFYSNHPNIQE